MGRVDFREGFLLPAANLGNICSVPLVSRGVAGIECLR
jgi:hypothetical protein